MYYFKLGYGVLMPEVRAYVHAPSCLTPLAWNPSNVQAIFFSVSFVKYSVLLTGQLLHQSVCLKAQRLPRSLLKGASIFSITIKRRIYSLDHY